MEREKLSKEEFDQALDDLERLGLIESYEEDGETYYRATDPSISAFDLE
ncbi:hypothetical protein [Halorubrum tebenquichense]|uniref:Uncharacterized protein n=1 Tax=Halorubrum tebenquichense DSM 14210 TaxID=1227485 RepID=M0E4M5_9EURY|nr:hypothetical protein [Halorubrum tebenquichense]ELZ41872.1 hypothetical protein C472_00474 [Halorubrum tebenquichense DSM 14210]